MSAEVEQIREALWCAGTGNSEHPVDRARDKALALLDGVTGLAHAGDVVLSAEQAARLRQMAENQPLDSGAMWEMREVIRDLLGSGPQGKEQA